MRRGSQATGENQRRHGISRWAGWSHTSAIIPSGLVLAGVAVFLAVRLAAPAASPPPGTTGASGPVAISPTVVVAPEVVAPEVLGSVPPDLNDVAASISSPSALAESPASSRQAETYGDVVSTPEVARAELGDETPAAYMNRDDLPPMERPDLASRGGPRPVEPSPQPTPQPTPTTRREVVTYQVVEGDTVSSLAQRFGVSAQTIVKANDLQDPERLSVGQALVILPISGVRHVVEDGDTLLALAARYSVIPEELAAVNGIAMPDRLSIGQIMLVPEVSSEKLAASVVPDSGGKVLKPISYSVASGDTLSGITARFGITVETLQWANLDLGSLDRLSVGQQLTVPPVDGALHRVQEGDTVSGVAALHSASAAELVRANGLADPYPLTLGQLLVVPGGRSPSTTAASQPVVEIVPTVVPTAMPVVPTARPQSTARSQPTARPTATPVPPKPTPAPAAPRVTAPAVARAPASPGGSAGSRIVGVAMQYRGYRYTWGGTSPQTGFDCSGFVWYVYRQAGVAITRDLWGQYNSGARVSRDALQPGDLVFFQNTYKPGLSHDGIYIGGGQFIQAASENTGVIVTSLSEPYWAARYLGATRPD